MRRVLTIAGSDSGGGAGVQADLKTITLLGEYGMSVLTALTAQNTRGVYAIHEVPAPFVEKQIEVVLSDIGADAIKTGMLLNEEIIGVVAKKIAQYGVKKVVVDPVMVAKNGTSLLREDGCKALIKRLIPLAMVVTPNLMEASILSRLKVSNLEEMKRAAHRIYQFGPTYVLVKGGHLKGMPVDVLYDGKRFTEMVAQRIESKNTHGTGCTFASALATFLAKGEEISEAVRRAKDFITLAIQSGFRIGKGNGPTNPSAYIHKEIERYRVIQELKKAMETLKGEKIGYLIPEVSSNLGYALPFAETMEEVAAFPGRIIRYRDSILTLGDPEFGASKHIARIILTLMKFDSEYRSAMNIRYSKENVVKLKEKGFRVGHFDRRSEPKRVKEKEGSSLEWGVREVLRKFRRVPDVIYDEGDMGKEPMIRVLGRDPMEVVCKILKGVGRNHSMGERMAVRV